MRFYCTRIFLFIILCFKLVYFAKAQWRKANRETKQNLCFICHRIQICAIYIEILFPVFKQNFVGRCYTGVYKASFKAVCSYTKHISVPRPVSLLAFQLCTFINVSISIESWVSLKWRLVSFSSCGEHDSLKIPLLADTKIMHQNSVGDLLFLSSTTHDNYSHVT
jgi:hypothetical protein